MLVPASISYLIWSVGGGGTLFALGLSYRRGLVREFPWFSAYLAFHIFEVVTAALVFDRFGRASWAYFYQYWILQAIGFALRFGIIYEIFHHLLQPYEGLRHASALTMRWVGALLILGAIVVAFGGPKTEPLWAVRGAVVLERSINVVQCGLLVLLFLFASYFALTWRNYVFGIALGFGIIATGELLASALATQSSMFAGGLFNLLPRISYDVAVLIWAVYLLSPEPPRMEIKALPQHELEKWNEELLELLHR